MTEPHDSLWNPAVGPSDYSRDADRYQQVVFEQYKLCVEMADRVSARRNLANTFFLTMNSAVVTVLAVLTHDTPSSSLSVPALAAGLVILLAQCAAWWFMVRSYRQLNAAKWRVIGMFEERLPAFAYSRAEWAMLDGGRNWRTYLPLTHVEQWVPVIFCVAYLLGFAALAL
ncbi:RipA family octameric membrane protein [Streptomyces capoamus]|uniref:RipA family octameric membrane protein n=1 Tax=Streptomyces capoamus TaxID=68183 RepID=UPI00339703C6